MNEARHKSPLLYDCIHMKCLEESNLYGKQTDARLPGAGGKRVGGEWELTTKGCRVSFEGEECVLKCPAVR